MTGYHSLPLWIHNHRPVPPESHTSCLTNLGFAVSLSTRLDNESDAVQETNGSYYKDIQEMEPQFLETPLCGPLWRVARSFLLFSIISAALGRSFETPLRLKAKTPHTSFQPGRMQRKLLRATGPQVDGLLVSACSRRFQVWNPVSWVGGVGSMGCCFVLGI